MTNSEPLGRNQAMKMILGQSQEDELSSLRTELIKLKNRVRLARFSEEKLKLIKFELNGILYELQKELMRAEPDTRISHIGPRSNEERASDSAD